MSRIKGSCFHTGLLAFEGVEVRKACAMGIVDLWCGVRVHFQGCWTRDDYYKYIESMLFV
jgi:hypothetical protein